MKYGIYIGATKESVREARAAVNDVLRSTNAETVKIAALDTLKNLCQVNGNTLSGITVGDGNARSK